MKKEVRNFSCIWKCCIDLGCDLDFTYYVCIFNLLDIDSMVDTFYAIGLVMRLCQLISLLELLDIYVGIESNHLLPRFLQVGFNHIICIIESVAYFVLFIFSLDFMAGKKPTFANLQPKSLTRRVLWKNYLILKHCTVRIANWKWWLCSGKWCLLLCATLQWFSPGRFHIHFSLSLCHCPGQYGTEKRHRIGAVQTWAWCLAPLPTTVRS